MATEVNFNSDVIQAANGESSQKYAYQQAMANLQQVLSELAGVTEPTQSQEAELAAALQAAYQAYEVLTVDGVSGDELYTKTAAVQKVWGMFGDLNINIDGIPQDGSLMGDALNGNLGALGNLISFLNEESIGGIDLSQLISDVNNATPRN